MKCGKIYFKKLLKRYKTPVCHWRPVD